MIFIKGVLKGITLGLLALCVVLALALSSCPVLSEPVKLKGPPVTIEVTTSLWVQMEGFCVYNNGMILPEIKGKCAPKIVLRKNLSTQVSRDTYYG